MDLRRDGQERLCYAIFGAGLRHRFNVGRKDYVLWINVTTPHIPLTSDGKEPDLTRVRDPLLVTLERAAKKAGRLARPGALQEERTSAKDVIVGVLDEAIDRASGGGVHRYSLRQLFYAVRPAFIEALGKEPEYTYFAQVIADHEGELGHDLPGIYRDERGLLYHPHTGEAIPLGTREVEEYERPPWTFNKILYCEKAGFFPVLQDARWPERHDCALLTSKGYASRAARDVLDRLGETGEPVTFFCIHDADGDGTLIYETLTQATRARGGRKVEIINLGLDPWEAVELGLPTEPITGRKQAVRVAGYVRERDPRWADWLREAARRAERLHHAAVPRLARSEDCPLRRQGDPARGRPRGAAARGDEGAAAPGDPGTDPAPGRARSSGRGGLREARRAVRRGGRQPA